MLCKFIYLLMISALFIESWSRKITCDLNDAVCVTKVCKDAYPNLIAGFQEAGVEPLDPARKDIITTDFSNVKFTLTNAYLYGLSSCDVKEVKIHEMVLKWDFYLICPLLIVESNYEINGSILSLNITGKGEMKAVYDTYHIKIKGGFDKIVFDDGEHMKLRDYETDLDVKGRVQFNFTNLYDGDFQKSNAAHKLLNGNWMKTNEIQDIIISGFIRIFFDNLNKFLDIVSNEELFTYEVE